MKISKKKYRYTKLIQKQLKYILLHILAQYTISLLDALLYGRHSPTAGPRNAEDVSLSLRVSS